MGLDLIISVQSDFDKDEQGRNTHKVTQIANLRNCWMIYDLLNDRSESGFSNCATHTFYGEIFYDILKELQEELEELLEDAERKKSTIEYNIKKLEKFITVNNVSNDPVQDYQIHVWY